MIRIAMVDDDPDARAILRAHLQRYQAEHATEFSIEEFTDGSEITASFAPRFDIIFLDVQMANLDGFATARIIRESDPRVALIFITNMAQFAIKGYEVDALSYLLKPVAYFAFSQELKRCIERVERNRDDYMMLAADGELIRVATKDIVYIESIKHRLNVITIDRKIGLVGTLKEMTEQLEPRDFFRTNSYLLVNLRHVTGVQGTDSIMTGGLPLPISRARRKPFLEALTAYFGSQPR